MESGPVGTPANENESPEEKEKQKRIKEAIERVKGPIRFLNERMFNGGGGLEARKVLEGSPELIEPIDARMRVLRGHITVLEENVPVIDEGEDEGFRETKKAVHGALENARGLYRGYADILPECLRNGLNQAIGEFMRIMKDTDQRPLRQAELSAWNEETKKRIAIWNRHKEEKGNGVVATALYADIEQALKTLRVYRKTAEDELALVRE